MQHLEKKPELWFIECYGLIKYTAILRSNKKKIVKTIFHQLQGYLVIYFKYFPFIFTLAKFEICALEICE